MLLFEVRNLCLNYCTEWFYPRIAKIDVAYI
jgi:hypothetical protein